MPAHRCKCLNESAGASPWVTAVRCNGDLECFAEQTEDIKKMITMLMHCVCHKRRCMAAATSLGTISKESKVACRVDVPCHDRGKSVLDLSFTLQFRAPSGL